MAEWFPADRGRRGLRPVPRALRRARRRRARSLLPGALDARRRGPPGRRAQRSSSPRSTSRTRTGASRTSASTSTSSSAGATAPGRPRRCVEHGAAVYVGDTVARHAAARAPRARSRSGVTTGPARPRTLLAARAPTSCSTRSRSSRSGSRRGSGLVHGGRDARRRRVRASRRPLSMHDDRAAAGTRRPRPRRRATRSSLRTDADASTRPRRPRGRRDASRVFAPGQLDARRATRTTGCTSASSCWSMRVRRRRAARSSDCDQLLVRQRPRSSDPSGRPSRDRVVGRRTASCHAPPRTSRSGPSGPLELRARCRATCADLGERLRQIQRRRPVRPPAPTSPTVHPAADRSASRTRSLQLPPIASAAATASASSATCTAHDARPVGVHRNRHRRIDLAPSKQHKRPRRAAPSQRPRPRARQAGPGAMPQLATGEFAGAAGASTVRSKGRKMRHRTTSGGRSASESALGTGPGELDRRGLDALDGAEDDLVALGVDDDRLAGVEFLPQDLLGQRVLDEALDRTAQRPGTERRRRSPSWRAAASPRA